MQYKNNKIFILGAGKSDISLIVNAHKLGLQVVVSSIPGDFPGFVAADKFYFEDILNKEKLLGIAKKEKVSAVTTTHALGVAPASYIADKLNMPGVGYQCAKISLNKNKFRQLCNFNSIPTPKYRLVGNYDEAINAARNIGFPIILKPIDGRASQGVTKVKVYDELLDAYNKALRFSRSTKILVEQYVQGSQLLSIGIVDKGELHIVGIGEIEYFDIENVFIPKSTIFPTQNDKKFCSKIEFYFKKIIKVLKPNIGLVFAEWIYNEATDQLYCIESEMRAAGSYITSDLLPNAYGINLENILIRLSLGEEISKNEYISSNNKLTEMRSFLLPEGKITDIKGIEKLPYIDGVLACHGFDFKLGDVCPSIENKVSRRGPFILEGGSRYDIENTLKEIKNVLTVEVENKSIKYGVLWD